MFQLIFDILLDLFFGLKYFLESIVITVLYLIIAMGIEDIKLIILIPIIGIAVFFLQKFLLVKIFDKLRSKNIRKTISYITLIGFIIYLLIYKFDLNLFNKNLKKFINEFLEMIKVVRGVIRIITS